MRSVLLFSVSIIVAFLVSAAALTVSLLPKESVPVQPSLFFHSLPGTQSSESGVAFAPAQAPAPAKGFRIFVKIPTAAGESTEAKHREWIETQSIGWNMSQTSGSSKAVWEDFAFLHTVDKSSPRLFSAFAEGAHIKAVLVELARSDTGFVFMRYQLEDVVISSVKTQGSIESDARPMEQVSLRPGTKVWLEYIPQRLDGSADQSIKVGWDLKSKRVLQ
ncbi:MAG: type VI secretion system tube protein Hcp [Chloroflexi bacterium]|nr:type VI secretion system tube protein Hcp [Chloroflexota bacterium]